MNPFAFKARQERDYLVERFASHPEEFLERLSVTDHVADGAFCEAIGILFLPCKSDSEAVIRNKLLADVAMRVVDRFVVENLEKRRAA